MLGKRSLIARRWATYVDVFAQRVEICVHFVRMLDGAEQVGAERDVCRARVSESSQPLCMIGVMEEKEDLGVTLARDRERLVLNACLPIDGPGGKREL